MGNWFTMPRLASQHGAALDHTNDLVHWVMLVLFVGWSLFFLYVLWRFRAKRNPGGTPRGLPHPHLDLARGRRGAGRGDPADRLLDPALGRARSGLPRAAGG